MNLRSMNSKYNSRCKRCSSRIRVGDPIRWSKDTGALCVSCGRSEEQPSPAPSGPSEGLTGTPSPKPVIVAEHGQEWRIDWSDLKRFVIETRANRILPEGYENQAYVIRDYVINAGGSFVGFTGGQLDRWLSEGYVSPALNFPEFNPPIREKRRLQFVEEGDEFHLDLAHSGHDNYMSQWSKRETIPGIRVDLMPKFQGDVSASVLNEYQAWTNSLIYGLESAGIDAEVNYIYQGVSAPSSVRHWTIVRLKKENEVTDFVGISPMLSPAAFRCLAFCALAMQGQEQGFKVGHGVSGKVKDYPWAVTVSEDKRAITVTNPYHAGHFPAEQMTEQFRSALREIMRGY